MNKAEIFAYMKAHPDCALATVEGNEPRVRAIGVYKISEEEIIIQTNVTKDLNKQLLKNPNVEMLFFNKTAGPNQIRVRGTVEPITDAVSLKKVVEDRPFLKDAIAKGSGPSLFRVKKPMAYVWGIEVNFVPKAFVPLY
jgi:pyridoxamine 5'-phosphate oxidase